MEIQKEYTFSDSSYIKHYVVNISIRNIENEYVFLNSSKFNTETTEFLKITK